MERKLREFFEFGASLVQYVEPKTRTVSIHTSPDDVAALGENQTLEGGEVRPGFEVNLKDVFDWAAQIGRNA
jgi:hypothetical protein